MQMWSKEVLETCKTDRERIKAIKKLLDIKHDKYWLEQAEHIMEKVDEFLVLPKSKQTTKYKKKLAVKVYHLNAGSISRTCSILNMSTATFYLWYRSDEEFKERIDAADIQIIDLSKSQLLKNIEAGKEQSIMFLLKTKGKQFGYNEKTELESTIKTEVKIVDDI